MGGGQPCGLVLLIGLAASNWINGAHLRKIRLSVHLSDGSVVDDDLKWPFRYASEEADPFTAVHRHDDFPTLLQTPPPGFDLTGEQKPATVFAVAHTSADGYTNLEPCPGAPAPPPAP